MDIWGGSAVIKCTQGSDVDKKLRDQKLVLNVIKILRLQSVCAVYIYMDQLNDYLER